MFGCTAVDPWLLMHNRMETSGDDSFNDSTMIVWIAVRTSPPTPAIVHSRIPEPWNVWASAGGCSGSIHNGTAERAIVDPVDTEEQSSTCAGAGAGIHS